MKYYTLTPQDAWFFRDGRPYNHGESNQTDVHSQFPPPARTLTGAMRAALARANGWNGGRGAWPDNVTEAFGSSPHDLGQLQFSGPFLIRRGEALWPLPRHLLGITEAGIWKPKAFLRPGIHEVATDQGRVILPETALPKEKRPAGLKPAEGSWITSSGLSDVLLGQLPPAKSVFSHSSLWQLESRVGFKRCNTTHLVGEGDLYSPSFVRLHRDVALGIGFNGLPHGMNGPPAWFPLGGESRLAQCETWQAEPLPPAPALSSFELTAEGRVAFSIVLLTPGAFTVPQVTLANLEIITACVGKPAAIGGWDSLRNEPLPLAPFHPAGSVWFCKATQEVFADIHAQHGLWLGRAQETAHGFGQFLIGHWPPSLR